MSEGLKPAHQKDAALVADIEERYQDAGEKGFGVWWLGQSGFLIKYQGQQLLFDPYLSDSLTVKYAETDKPHVRLSERVVDPASLTGLAVTTSSHNHTDHLDAETLGPLVEANPDLKLVIPEANLAFAEKRLESSPMATLGLDDGSEQRVGAFHFTGVAAAHNEMERDESGRCRFLGFLVRFGPWTVYHSGDTLWHDGLVERLLPAGVDLMLLPINGNKPERRVAGNLNAVEAAGLARACNARMVIPCHYDMFAFNTADPEEFVSACQALSQPHCVLRGGERWDSAGLG